MSEVPSTTYLQILIQGATAAIALGALILSIYNNYLQRRDKRPQLKIRGSVGWLLSSTLSESSGGEYFIEVANTGQMPVTISQIYIGIKGDEKLAFPPGLLGAERSLPCRIEIGDSAQWWIDLNKLRVQLKEVGYKGWASVTLLVHDKLGTYHSKRVTIRVSEPPWYQKVYRFFSHILRFKKPFLDSLS